MHFFAKNKLIHLAPYSLLAASFLAMPLAHARETAKVLPAGIHRVRVVGVATSDIRDSFNSKGQEQSISFGLNRTVTMQDLANNADASTKSKLLTLISSLNTLQTGLGDSLAASDLNSDLKVKQNIYLGAFEYGVTSKLNLGIRMPVVKRTVTHSFNVNDINNAAYINGQIGNLAPAVTSGLYNVSQQKLDTAFFERALFTNKGYQAPHNFQKTELGDIELGGKFNFHRTETSWSSLVLGTRVPTGSRPVLVDPFDPGNSKQCWGVGAQLIEEFQATSSISFSAAAKYSYNFNDTRERAVPKNEGDSLPSLLPQDEQIQRVTRKMGNMIDTDFSALYRFAGESMGIWTGYQYSRKNKDTYTGPGNSAGSLYYAGLEKNTDTQLHAGEVGAEYSTIPAFRKGKFSVPMEVSLLYNRPFAGKNTPIAPYVRMDLMLYF